MPCLAVLLQNSVIPIAMSWNQSLLLLKPLAPRARNCAVTAQVMDMFVEQTHNIDTQMRDGEKPMRFTDTRLDEQERGVSLKMVPMSLVMEGTSGKSYLMNLIDTPGGSLDHPMSQLIQALLMSSQL